MQFANLLDHPCHFPLVARWNWEEWRHLLAERSVEEFEHWLRSSVARDVVPMTLLAIEGDAAIGTVSLVEQDLSTRHDLSPWLASLYVIPDRRGTGLGRALVEAAVSEARRLGYRALHLYTPVHESFYAGLGWMPVEAMRYRGTPITIMQRAL